MSSSAMASTRIPYPQMRFTWGTRIFVCRSMAEGLDGCGGGFGFKLGAEGGVEVAAGDDDGDFAGGYDSGKFERVEEGECDADCAGGFGDDVGGGEKDAKRGADFVFSDGDDAVDKLEDVLEVECAEGLGAEAVT